jgi:rhodanese-related sulfurtransferase
MTPEEAFEEGSDVRYVPASTIAAAMDQGIDIQIVDARPETDYEFGHIPGAINVPYFDVEQHLDELPQDRWLVMYCECPTAEADQVADALEANGFTKVRVMEEGLSGWRDGLGRPLEGGTS